ncbi:RF_mod_PrmC: protein-(glutamine-N5) methyltransferase, release factor-specific [Propionibacterium ruminifibrarum]|uniref:Release factor glutamine methyltransferase n=1 Tax=Propionibacterium ruminifibrarum TaxID=1962131 RepID=A0A375HXI6_9ACTN|nr:peptide chain release factor N(5)-glutamine methyltransferase [Propionibacterium ruminifibrarum]SPF67204.1 RF_mod_PrmC: protein-(glutamine-N5) methyltransferase, release factor-specific [Propionibacterium ruminifibrarum]
MTPNRPAAMIREGIERLARAGLPTPRADARLLLAHAARLEPSGLATTRELDDVVARRYEELLVRRSSGEPLQHLTGVAWFRTIKVLVGPGVFIPRPETESVVQFALRQLVALRPSTGPEPVVVDLCTGSGVIAASIADEYPGRPRIWAVENSDEALQWARRNLEPRGVEVVHADMADALHELDGHVDLVVANPPYIPETAASQLPADVVDHDPHEALFAGADGLDALRVLAGTAARLLRTGGWLVAEHDDTQGGSAPQLLADTGFFHTIEDHPDLTGLPRFVSAVRAPRRPRDEVEE